MDLANPPLQSLRSVSIYHGPMPTLSESFSLAVGNISSDAGHTSTMPLGCFAWTPNTFQVMFCANLLGRILNVASGDDPHGLGDLFGDVVNMDLPRRPDYYKTGKKKPKNFIPGSVFEIPFPDREFDGVLLGEFLEHATHEAAVRAMRECARVVKRDGMVAFSIPFDAEGADHIVRNPGCPDSLVVSEGVTVGHQHLWTHHELGLALAEAGLCAVQGTHLFWAMGHYACSGVGVVCVLRESADGGIGELFKRAEPHQPDSMWKE